MEQRLGKMEHHLVEQFIVNRCGQQRSEVATGPSFGADVAVIDLPGGMALALTSDPLSLIPSLGLQESAWLSVHLMANDMATTGQAPMYGQFVLNLPSTFSKQDFKMYWEYIHKFCVEINVAITGGHTGFVEGQHSAIAGGGTLATIAPKDKLLVSKSAEAGNAILVTKTCALSSAAILAMSFPQTVKNQAGAEIYQLACDSFYHTSSLQDALLAAGVSDAQNKVTAMHDVTEGGVLGAIYELCVVSGNGATIYNNQLPVAEVQEQVCKIFGLDPRCCIGAGSMIIACKKEFVAEIVTCLAKEKIPCVAVGELCDKRKGIKLVNNDKFTDLKYVETDPYWPAFYEALKKGST